MQALHHRLDLRLGRPSVAHHRLLDGAGAVLDDAYSNGGDRGDRGAARLPEQQRRVRVDVDEDALDRDLVRPPLVEQGAEVVEDRDRQQENLERDRHALAEQRQHADREMILLEERPRVTMREYPKVKSRDAVKPV